LFFWERISAVVAAVRLVPAARLEAEAVGDAGAAAEPEGVDGAADGVLELVVGRMGRDGVRGAGAGALAVGWSFSSAVVSTGASWRSRLRLSAVATCSRSPRPQAARVANVSAAISVLDIQASLM